MLPSNARCAVPCNAVVRCLMHCLALQALMKQRPFGDTNALLVVHQKIAEFNETQSIWYNYVKFYDMSNVDVTFARRSWKRKERIDNSKSQLLAATIDVSNRSSGQGGNCWQALMPWAMQFPVCGCHGISANRCGSHTIGGMILWFHQFPRDVSFWVQGVWGCLMILHLCLFGLFLLQGIGRLM